MSADHGVARIVGGLIAAGAVAVMVIALFFLLQINSHFNANGAQWVFQLFLALAIAAAIAVLGVQFTIRPEHRPRLASACGLLAGALVSTALLAVAPPPASFLLMPIAVSLAGGAWVVGARVGE